MDCLRLKQKFVKDIGDVTLLKQNRGFTEPFQDNTDLITKSAMKKYLFFLMCPLQIFAQQHVPQIRGNDLLQAVAERPHVASFAYKKFETSIPIEQSVKNNFILNHPSLSNPASDLQLISKIESGVGIHLYYQQMFNGIAVYNGYLKVNLNKNGEQLSNFDHLYDTRTWKDIRATTSGKEAVIIVENEKPFIASKEIKEGTETVYDANNSQLFSRDLKMHYMADDTMVTAKVFKPDPLTSSGVSYGKNGTYMNFNDSDYALLDDQRASVSFPATLDIDTFRLANKYCIIVDHLPPANAPSVSKNPDFTFMRGQAGFKDAMVMYHIYNYQQYLQSIGFNNAVNWQLQVDPFSGFVDNSYFLPQATDTTINFGIGGVPDAEDADVIVHEYTHAVRFSLNPAWPVGADRWAVEEGTCDLMAALYSHVYSSYNWRWFYNWDGHNEFWNGRDGNTINAALGRMKVYSDVIGDRYYDAEVWSSCLLDIDEVVGRDVVTTLMLTAVYSLTPNTTMPEAAQLFMQADSLVYNKANSWKMGTYFNQRELGTFSTGINDVVNQASFKILNTAGFATGEGDAVILLDKEQHADVSVFDLKGTEVFEAKQATGNVQLDPSLFTQGMYLLIIDTGDQKYQTKLIRAN